ncbi:RNA-processing protein [Candidatus Woesearchaeota archaeon]|nr:RNA-processing protein [Candidatus Woesearchaeota archaeon]
MVEEFEEEMLIPKERIAVLIGDSGRDKKEIEKAGKIKLEIHEKENLVKIKAKDPLALWLGQQVVEAVGRGFNPKIAQKIFKEENSFELIRISDYEKSKKKIKGLKGRIIGTQGKTKKIIQNYTNTNIVVYGKTIGIIGPREGTELARRAIEILLTGAKHGTAYRFLQEQTKND